MKFKLDRIISIATLVASLTAIILVLKKPAPVQPPPAGTQQSPTSSAQTSPAQSAPSSQPAQSSAPSSQSSSPEAPAPAYAYEGPKPSAGQGTAQPTTSIAQNAAPASGNSKADLPSSDQLSAIIAKTLGGSSGPLTPDSNVGSGEPNIKDQQVTMDGDIVHGKFLTEINGKDTWVTISGHMGEKDGYATFDPTEFKVGDTEVPVSVVNPLLQQKLAEERGRLKVPNN